MTEQAKDSKGGLSRGQFLAGAVGAGGTAVASAVLPSAAGASIFDLLPAFSYTPGHFELVVDGVASELQDFDNAGQIGLVIESPLEPGAIIAKKHVANIKWNECTVSMGMGLDKGLYNWIQQSFDKSYVRKSGQVVAADFNYREQSRVAFDNAVITELTLPACDGASKEAAKMLVTFNPEALRTVPSSGQKTLGQKQKAWLCSNFRVSIDGVDTRRVNSVDSFTWKQAVVEGKDPDGTLRAAPGKITFPDLSFTINESDAGPIKAWFQDSVVAGNNATQRNGKVEYLAPDNKTVLATLSLTNVGIFKVAPDKQEANSDRLRAARLGCHVWCEDAKLTF